MLGNGNSAPHETTHTESLTNIYRFKTQKKKRKTLKSLGNVLCPAKSAGDGLETTEIADKVEADNKWTIWGRISQVHGTHPVRIC